jgi:hypothetical protein
MPATLCPYHQGVLSKAPKDGSSSNASKPIAVFLGRDVDVRLDQFEFPTAGE